MDSGLRRRLGALCMGWVCLWSGAWAQALPADDPPEPPTHSALQSELFFDLLIAEIRSQARDDPSGPRDAFVLFLEAAQKHKNERLFERAVRVALDNRVPNSALQAIRAWKQALPRSVRANRFHLEILLSLNRGGEALVPLQQDLAWAPADQRTALIERLPYALANLSDKKQALELLEQALAPYRQGAATANASWVALARMRMMAGQGGPALEALGKVQGPVDAGMAVLAVELLAHGVVPAERFVVGYLENTTGATAAQVRLAYARALLRQGRLPDAREQLLAVTRADARLALPYLILGSLDMEARRHDSAAAHLEKYLELSTDPAEEEPGHSQAHLALAQIAQTRGRMDEALSHLGQVPNGEQVLALQVRRAGVLAAQGRMDEAQTLLANFPVADKDGQRRRLLARYQLFMEHQRHAQADALLEQALRAEPGDPDLLYEQAMVAEKLEQFARMETLLRELIALKPNHHHALNALGYHFADRNIHLPEARALIEKALSLAPGDPYITDSLAWVEFRSGNLVRARALLEQAFGQKQDAEIAIHLGEVYWVMGDKDAAVQMFRKARETAPQHPLLLPVTNRLGVSF